MFGFTLLISSFFLTVEMIKVLILGDGNFSFTLALCRLLFNDARPRKQKAVFNATSLEIEEREKARKQRQVAIDYLGIDSSNNESPIQIIATSFDSRQQLLSKYQETKEIIPAIERFGSDCVRLIHQINAWELSTHFGSITDGLVEGQGANDSFMPIGKQSFDIVGKRNL